MRKALALSGGTPIGDGSPRTWRKECYGIGRRYGDTDRGYREQRG